VLIGSTYGIFRIMFSGIKGNELERVKCPVCASGEFSPFMKQHNHTLVRCNYCGFVYLNPRPPADQILNYYDPDFWWGNDASTKSRRNFFGRIESMFLNLKMNAALKLLMKHQKTGKILDVGCGNGRFMELCINKGFDIYGVEPSEEARSRMTGNVKKRIIGKYLDGLNSLKGEFDSVLLIHSLEHMHNPRESLDAVNQALKSNGILFIQVPNIGSMQARILGSKWGWLFLPQHLNQFTVNTIGKLLNEAGFEISATERVPAIFNAGGWVSSFLPWNPAMFHLERPGFSLWVKKFFYFCLLLLFLPVSAMDNIITGGGILTVIARKKVLDIGKKICI